MKSTFSSTFGWLGAVGLAVALAYASPNEASVMGRLPSFMAQTLSRQPVTVPQGLQAERTLALITFQKGQRPQIDSWIQGLNLNSDASIAWLRMPVLSDPGTTTGRSAVENKLLQHYQADAERARLVPVFTDQASFIRSAGLNGAEQASVVVINRQGDILARVEGQFDADKAQTLRETLKQQDL